ncbi:MAG: helix-turn-helix domain-containing protein [Gammaproteobacteria bacterium]
MTEMLDQSFFDYVNAHRIEVAKALLSAGHDSVIDVAYGVGFNSRSAF